MTVTLPVYPLTLTVTVKSDAGTLNSLTATDAGGGDTLTLNGVKSGTSATGIPLGQFELGAAATGSNHTVSSGGNSPVYVWMLTNGYCESSSAMSQPCTGSAIKTAALAVQVG